VYSGASEYLNTLVIVYPDEGCGGGNLERVPVFSFSADHPERPGYISYPKHFHIALQTIQRANNYGSD
jgi:hypothetical protein